MKATAEKSSTTTSTSVTSAFAKATADKSSFAKATADKFSFANKAARPFFAPVQTKLTVGKRDDALEREADAVAERVVKYRERGQWERGQAPFQGASPRRDPGWEEKEKLRRQSWAGSGTPDLQRQEEPGEPEVKEEVETAQAETEPVQAKLKQGEKREEQVWAKSTPGAKTGGQAPSEPVPSDEEPLQAKRAELAVLVVTPDMKSRLGETKGEGRPLPSAVRAHMEAGFGIDFGQVRIHTDRSSAELSSEIRAEAFTHGSDIYFNEGKYSETLDGQKLLAHELTHVVQQNRSQGVPPKPAHRKLVGEKALEPVDLATPFVPPAHPSAAPASPGGPAAAAVLPPPAPAPKPASAPELKEAAPALPPETEGAPGEKKEIEKAPAKPKDDPDFQTAKKGIRKDARKQKSHEHPGKKEKEMTAAAALTPVEQREQSAQELKAAALESAAKPRQKFDRVAFKNALQKKIEEKLPDTEDQAKEFPSSGKLDEAKSEFGATVSEEKGKLTDPLKQTAEAPPPPGQVTKTEIPVPAAKPADKPSKIPPQLAAPKPRTDEEISLQEKSDDLDRRMKQEKMTEPQLAESEEPLFENALVKKQDAQREIAAAPARYREQEAKVLDKAQQQTGHNTGRRLQSMATVKNRSVGGEGVRGSQVRKESQTEIRQREIKITINGIYTRTESDVQNILKNLSTMVQIKFDTSAQVANWSFNSRVRSRLDDHYGWFTFDDKIAEAIGLSDGVAHIFKEEKQNFLDTMDKVLDEIATTVETELNRALLRIQQGRDELNSYKNTLSKEELKFADDLFKEVEDKFTDLESAVEEQQEELLETLSDLYVENVGKLQEEFDKINEELGSSWIADAINFIGEVASALRKLGALLKSIVDRIGALVDQILDAPKRFFNNLVSGIGQGIDKFTSNIGTYLQQGFWMWLTGASSARNIQIPEKMDPMGMFSLALQMIGIDRAFIMERIRIKLGAGVENLLTRAEAGAGPHPAHERDRRLVGVGEGGSKLAPPGYFLQDQRRDLRGDHQEGPGLGGDPVHPGARLHPAGAGYLQGAALAGRQHRPDRRHRQLLP